MLIAMGVKGAEQLNLQLGVQDVLSYGGNSTALPAVVSDVEVEERIKVGKPPCRVQERGVEKSFLNRLGGHGLGSGGFRSGPTGLGLGEA